MIYGRYIVLDRLYPAIRFYPALGHSNHFGLSAFQTEIKIDKMNKSAKNFFLPGLQALKIQDHVKIYQKAPFKTCYSLEKYSTIIAMRNQNLIQYDKHGFCNRLSFNETA